MHSEISYADRKYTCCGRIRSLFDSRTCLRESVIEFMLMVFIINETLRLSARQTVKLQKRAPQKSRAVCLKMSPSAALPLVSVWVAWFWDHSEWKFCYMTAVGCHSHQSSTVNWPFGKQKNPNHTNQSVLRFLFENLSRMAVAVRS